MKLPFFILLLLMLNSNANDKSYCLFHFKSPKLDYTQQANSNIICSYVVEKGYDNKYIIASSGTDQDYISILIKVEQIETISDSVLGEKIKSTGIKNTAEWFLSLTLEMPYRFNPNLSVVMHKMQYLNSGVGEGSKDKQQSPKNPPLLKTHPPAVDK